MCNTFVFAGISHVPRSQRASSTAGHMLDWIPMWDCGSMVKYTAPQGFAKIGGANACTICVVSSSTVAVSGTDGGAVVGAAGVCARPLALMELHVAQIRRAIPRNWERAGPTKWAG